MTQISEVAIRIFELADSLGVKGIRNIWQHQIDKKWRVGVNGHREEVDVPASKDFMGAKIPPFSIAIWYNGWLAGLLTPPRFDGVMVAGEAANEDTFIEAINKRLKE